MNTKKIFGMTLLAAAMTASQALAGTADLWLHVKVHEGADSRVTINLPLSVVQKTGAFIPKDSTRSGKVRFDDEELSVAEMREIWSELQRKPDATFITVDDVESKVRVAKKGGYLHIQASERRGPREDVEIKIPVRVVNALLSGNGEEFDIAAAIDALADEGEGELVTVNGDNETVRIWIDAVSEAR